MIWALILLLIASSVAIKEEARIEIPEMIAVERVVATESSIYLLGTRENYLIAQRLSSLWGRSPLLTISFPASVSLVGAYAEGGVAYALVAVRDRDPYVAKVRLAESPVVEKRYPMYPRYYPLSAVELGDSLFVAGSHLTIFDDVDYMIARLGERGPLWSIEDKGGRGNESYRCLLVTPEGRLLALGDSGENIVVTVLTQLGDVISNSTIRYNRAVRITDCYASSGGRYLISGTVSGLPLIAWLHLEGSTVKGIKQLIINDTIGVATSIIEVGNATISFVASIDGSNKVVIADSRSMIIIAHWDIALQGGLVLASTFWNGSIVAAGKGRQGGEMVALSLLLIENKEPNLLARLSDPGITLLLILLVSAAALLAYKRRQSASISR